MRECIVFVEYHWYLQLSEHQMQLQFGLLETPLLCQYFLQTNFHFMKITRNYNPFILQNLYFFKITFFFFYTVADQLSSKYLQIKEKKKPSIDYTHAHTHTIHCFALIVYSFFSCSDMLIAFTYTFSCIDSFGQSLFQRNH